MSRTSDRAILLVGVLGMLAATGCQDLDGRNRNRAGNRDFREMQFVDAAAEYERALTEVQDPIIQYNLGLAYSKVFKVGLEGESVVLDVQGSFACSAIPNTTTVTKQVCVKPGDKHFAECDDRNVCPSSFKCEKTQLCAIDDAKLADMAADHFEQWMKSHPDDTETRGIMTQVWIDSSQYKKAIDYWENLLKQKPDDPEIMGALAGINLKANDWRKSIEWYTKVADASSDKSAKVAAYQFIGNVAWSKLNSKTLTQADSIELADRGIGALQKAAELQPDNPKPVGLAGSLFNFRAIQHGASWAGAIDRASAQDLHKASSVLINNAKKAQGLPTTPAPAAPAAPAPPPPAGASAGAAPTTGG